MPDDDQKKPSPDQPETPAPEAEPSPAPETEKPEVEEKTEPEVPEESGRWSQAAYTKFTQEYTPRLRRIEEALEQLAANSRAEHAESAEPETPENPQIEKVIRGTKAYRDLEARNQKLEQAFATLSEAAVTQQFPDLKEDMPNFRAWLKQNPGIQGLSDKAILGAYRAENPAKGRRAEPTRPAPKQPPRVETTSSPRGVSRDIRDKMREQGRTGRLSLEDVFDVAVTEARREVAASGE